MIKKIVFFLAIFFTLKLQAAGFETSSEWLALVHYQESLFGGHIGTIKNDAFYLSKNGRKNPKAELDATIDFFENNEDDEKKCLFPARYMLLKKNGLVTKDFPKCAEFEQFKDDLRPSGVTLLFTDAYMNNSSSLFGHTLIRIDTARKGTQLLAHGVNYGAWTGGYENSPLYAIYGLLGFFQGGLTTKPYYDTINQYNNIENRDIWEYNIDFSKEEQDMFVAHIWEVGHITTPYYFFSQNCSYMLMEIFDAVRPSLKLAASFKGWTIPLDTVKEVNKREIVKDINYRPSRERKIKHRLKQMSKNQKKAFFALIEDENSDISFLEDDQKADVLETAYQYIQYRYVAKKLDLKDYRRKSFKMLQKRNQNSLGQKFNDLTQGNDPKDGHDSAQIGVDFGLQNGRVFEQLHLRPAYHSLTDNPFGYLKGAAINFLDLYFRHYDRHDEYVFEKIRILELDSFSPVSRGFVAPSYRIKVDLSRQINMKKKKTGYVSTAEVAGGSTFSLTDNFWFYTMSSVDAAYGGFLKDNAWAGLSFFGGILYSGERIGTQLELKKTFATDKQGSVFEQSAIISFHLLRNTDLEAGFSRKTISSKSLTEITFGIKQFF